jgi:hypothetical protein
MTMEKYAAAGAKKLLSLTKTKIRLAKEANTIDCKPAPLPLVKFLSGVSIETIDSSAQHREKLLKEIDYSNDNSVASTVFQCMDIIEGVKHKYEPEEYCFNLCKDELLDIEKKAKERNEKIIILIMSDKSSHGINLYLGEKENKPENAIYLSGVPTSLAEFILFGLKSDYFSSQGRLRNIKCVLGRKTLINNAISASLAAYGADLIKETE